MKKLLSLVLILSIIFSLAACKDANTVEDSTLGNSEETTSEQPQNSNDDNKENDNKDNKVEPTIKKLYGYQFYFKDEIIDDSGTVGFIARTDTYDVVLTKTDSIDFNSWDSIVEDCEELVWKGLYGGLRYSCSNQSVYESESFTNGYGEELLKVKGTWELEDGGYLDCIVIYYVTDEGTVRAIIGVPNNGDIDTVENAMDYIAENLQKAE